MEKKLKSLSDLANIKFKDLAPSIDENEETPTELPKQYLEAHYSSKGRAGKVVTLIKGFHGSEAELKALAKALKTAIKVGGTVKNEEILIQGDHREKIMETLNAMGHQVKRIGG